MPSETCLTKGRVSGCSRPPEHTPAEPRDMQQGTRAGGNPPADHGELNPRSSPAPGTAGRYKRGAILLSRVGGEVQVRSLLHPPGRSAPLTSTCSSLIPGVGVRICHLT